jgi:hypothetical protein
MKTTKQFSLILALGLAVVSSTALADWIEIEKFDDGMRVFVDRTTARRSGDTARVTHLVRWGEAQRDPGNPPYLSTVVQTAYDCVAKGEKYLSSTSYAGAMGNGAIVVSDEDEVNDWYSISESSMEDELWKIACAAR